MEPEDLAKKYIPTRSKGMATRKSPPRAGVLSIRIPQINTVPAISTYEPWLIELTSPNISRLPSQPSKIDTSTATEK